MKTKTLLVLITVWVPSICFSQNSNTDPVCKSRIRELGFMTGKWTGTAWTLNPDGEKPRFQMSQNVQFMLDTTLLQIERKGIKDGETIYHELDIISFVRQDSTFVFDTFLSTGNSGRFKGTLKDNTFYWYPYRNTGYTISLNEQGQWHETGQMSNEEMQVQFIEIILDKK